MKTGMTILMHVCFVSIAWRGATRGFGDRAGGGGIYFRVTGEHMSSITKAPRGRQGNAKLIVRNKVFECLTLLKIEIIEYGKMGFKMA